MGPALPGSLAAEQARSRSWSPCWYLQDPVPYRWLSGPQKEPDLATPK